ncbi:DUF5995 family protein [Chitinophaga niabensis]|uniref:Uncharacterized protein n=1 Tax=Chitinophaga niabensis TaxID=536979 RepID=A0A1N6D162_9BACT|nr:DUF5995 family protein [Chitinophaga niabensis]SIN64427.1 hypothetical protein SAMN04488055_0061 [Chitinophaga niabensis]
MAANTIDEVILQLEQLIEECIDTNSRIGFFASLYYKVTVRVKEGILNNEFEDGARMERLDVFFANRYLEAVQQWKAKKPTSGPWASAFSGTKKPTVILLQQLLLGMNAHINYDLGIAAVDAAAGQDIQSLHKDFISINTIIGSLTFEVTNAISRISPLLSLVGMHANNGESILIQFSISNARDGAWSFAEELAGKTGEERAACLAARDQSITKLADALKSPKGFVKITTFIIFLFEWKSPRKIIRVLYDYKKKFFHYNKKAA